jgi:hypothetical protein
MPANINPIFTLTPETNSDAASAFGGTISASAGDYTGISANYVLVHTAGADGSYVKRLRIKSLGANIAGVLRIFINNGGVNTTATNNVFYGEISLPSTSATSTAATVDLDYPMEFQLDPGYRIYVGLGAAASTAGWRCVCIAAQY